VYGGRYAGGQPRGAGGGAWVGEGMSRNPDPVLVGMHEANIEFPLNKDKIIPYLDLYPQL
jgi:hypothetical protein